MKILLLFISLSSNILIIYAQQSGALMEKEIVVQAKGCSISGTLSAAPGNTAKQKLVIIIAGSGPTDRDGNSAQFGLIPSSYKMLAAELAKQNIASFRFDKRGVGKSIPANFKEADMVFDDLVNDVTGIYSYMKDTLGFADIYIAGHSEGSLIGMIVAERKPVRGYISISGPARTIDEMILEQLTTQQQPDVIVKQVADMFTSLKAGIKIDSVPQYLYQLFRPSVQPYMISWLKYVPVAEIKKLSCPVLILQGSCDIQVKVKDAESLHESNQKSKLDVIPNMTHTLKDAGENCKDENQKTYKDGTLPLNIQLVSDIVSFINAKGN